MSLVYEYANVHEMHVYMCICVYICIYAYVFSICIYIQGGYGQQDRLNYRSLLQNIVSFVGLFCKRDLLLIDPNSRSHPTINIFMSYLHNIYMYTCTNIVYMCLSCIHVFINVFHIYAYTNTLIRTYMHELFVQLCIYTYTHTSKLCKHIYMQLPLISAK